VEALLSAADQDAPHSQTTSKSVPVDVVLVLYVWHTLCQVLRVNRRDALRAGCDDKHLRRKIMGRRRRSRKALCRDASADAGAALALEPAIYGDLFATVPKTENRNNSAAIN